MEITFQSEGVEHPSLDENALSQWIESVAKKHNRETGEISYLFCDDNKILEVNQQYLNHDFYTDIITFDYCEENMIAGDIIISLQTVKSNSQMYNTDFKDELHRVIIHGILHLCGQGDLTEEEEKEMRDAENDALEMLITE